MCSLLACVDITQSSRFIKISGRYMKRSHSISVPQNAHVDQNTICAVLRLSVACFSCLFPLPTFSVVSSESATSWLMCSACMFRFAARVVCNSEISRRDFSAALSVVSWKHGK